MVQASRTAVSNFPAWPRDSLKVLRTGENDILGKIWSGAQIRGKSCDRSGSKWTSEFALRESVPFASFPNWLQEAPLDSLLWKLFKFVR